MDACVAAAPAVAETEAIELVGKFIVHCRLAGFAPEPEASVKGIDVAVPLTTDAEPSVSEAALA